MKKMMYVLLALVMILGLAACGSEKQEAATEEGFSPALDTSTECAVTVAGGYDNFEALETEFDNFNEYYPNVELTFTKVDDFNNMIGMVLDGNDAPDIYVNYSWMYGREQYNSSIDHAEDLADPALGLDLDSIRSYIILNTEDLEDEPEQTQYLMTIEGMCGICDEPEEKIQWLYDMGNRIGSLEWNDQNALATGNSGDPGRGLTELGVRAVRKMNDLHMIIDISHANEKTFWDILSASDTPIIATHSNAKGLCFVERNLTDQQIRALTAKGGLIGMNACAGFIDKDPQYQDAYHLAKHARYIADLAGAEHVACGFDFTDYYGEGKHDISGPEKAQAFIEGLRACGFSEDEIKDIAYRNVLRFLQKYM